MMNLLQVRVDVLDHLMERKPDGQTVDQWRETVRSWSWEQCFDEWCDYEGLIGYGPKLRTIIANLKKAEEKGS